MNWLNNRDRIGALLMLVFSVAYLSQVGNIRLLPFLQDAAFSPRTLPYVLAGLGIILSLIMLFQSPKHDPGVGAWQALSFGRGALLCLAMIAYGLGVRPLGFVFMTTLFLMFGFIVMGERNWKIILGASLPISLFFWYLMDQIIGISLQAMPEFPGG